MISLSDGEICTTDAECQQKGGSCLNLNGTPSGKRCGYQAHSCIIACEPELGGIERTCPTDMFCEEALPMSGDAANLVLPIYELDGAAPKSCTAPGECGGGFDCVNDYCTRNRKVCKPI